ncbi:MAG: glycosyltransferase [Candidatus Korobacteraceae bacterium]
MQLKEQPALSPSQVKVTAGPRRRITPHSIAGMVLAGFLVRLLYILLAHSYRFRTNDYNFSFGWEIGRIAYSIATGRGFSSPFGGETGPSAWTAPVYPYIVALSFRLFGIYTHAAAIALLTFNSLCAAVTCWPIVRIARRVFNERVAFWSGWIWALFPYIAYWAVRWVWETSLSALLLTLLFMLTLDMEGDRRLLSWFGYGLLWGVLGLTNSAALAFLPFSGLWLAYGLYRRKLGFILPAVVGAVVFWLTMMPWLVRNYEVFHKPVFVRDNVGVEFRCGNNPLAEGIWVGMYHPTQNELLFQRYKQLGEADYSAEQSRLAKQWIADHPRKFAIVSFRRFIYFWTDIPSATTIPEWMIEHHTKWAARTFHSVIFRDDGTTRAWLVDILEQLKPALFLASTLLAWGGLLLALKRRAHGVFLFTSLVIFYPLVYYFAFPHPRYRHPIEPELLILGVYLVTEARRRQMTAEETKALAQMDEMDALPVFHTLSIIIPVYNERRTVMKLLKQVAAQPISLHKELVIVDDFSTDGTREFLQQVDLESVLGDGGRNSVRLVLHEKNMGKGAGVRTGLANSTGDMVLIQDADLEYDPGDYPALMKPILEGHADAVFGNRFHNGSHRVQRYYRYKLNRAFSVMCNILTGITVHDVTACYKVFKRDLLERMHLRSDRFSVETEMAVKVAKLSARIYEVPIVYHGRTYAEGKKISWSDGWIALYDLVRYHFGD